ncbi:C2H2 type zinc-finger-domain-containing protein [Parasitella parasitica]|nr:C2H2 type zinc-finger-domain-containing protein [Parasitella parasitica]
MSTIQTEFNPSFKDHQPKPSEPKSAIFTCLSCQVAFPSSGKQRDHFRTDWHKYNLKRKIANLSSVNAEQFAQKVLAQQQQGLEEHERQGLIYECPLCKKSYYSENGYNNHVQSKKHLEQEQRAEEKDENSNQDAAMVNSTASSRQAYPTTDCLFCNQGNRDMDANLDHMSKAHGFFLPDIEYLRDRQGLVKYLFDKIQHEKLCLYCNGRGKEWHSAAAACAHMLDRGHCKMAYDESEDPEQLLKFYDFDIENIEPADADGGNANQYELVLENGVKLGHRKFLKYYRKNQARKPLVAPEVEETQQQPETLRRKERRHLAITDGKEQEVQRTAEGIKETAKKQDFVRQVAFKQNSNQLLRARIQNPI